MVFDTTNLERGHLVLSPDPADVGPQTRFDLRQNPWFAILRAEGEMVITQPWNGWSNNPAGKQRKRCYDLVNLSHRSLRGRS